MGIGSVANVHQRRLDRPQIAFWQSKCAAIAGCPPSSFVRRLIAFYSPLPLPSPLGEGLVLSGLLCGGQRENIHNKRFRSKRFGINRLCGARLAKILIRGGLRIKYSGPKGYGRKRGSGASGSGKRFTAWEILVKY